MFTWELKDLPYQWPNICMVVGAGVLFEFVPLVWSGEKPWDSGEAAIVTGTIVDARHHAASRSVDHSVRYAFELNGRPHTGAYECSDGCYEIERAQLGQSIAIEYRLDDPEHNRPAGSMSRHKFRAWRVVTAMGVVVLLVGVAARVFGWARQRDD